MPKGAADVDGEAAEETFQMVKRAGVWTGSTSVSVTPILFRGSYQALTFCPDVFHLFI